MGPQVLAGTGTITAIDGLTFVISDELGDISPGSQGLLVRDTRHVSRFTIAVNGDPLKQLGAALLGTTEARFHTFADVGPGPDASLEVERRRQVIQGGFDELVILSWWGDGQPEIVVELVVDADFADIFQVRILQPGTGTGSTQARWVGKRLQFRAPDGRRSTQIRFTPTPEVRDGGRMRWSARPRRGTPWRLEVEVRAGPDIAPLPRFGAVAAPRQATVATLPDRLARACQWSLRDLASLSMPDAMDPSRRMTAAGLPWFVALFGRDSLIVAMQSRVFDRSRLVETLTGLAARQGTIDDPGNEEAPGKILHEVRLTERQWLGEGTEAGARPYFGSVDATPLFLIAVGMAWRWGASGREITNLLPAAQAALGWIQRQGQSDADGFLRYHARSKRTLRNQGWKDSENAIQFADGRLATGPLALLEVQGYQYRARRELAAILRSRGDEAAAEQLDHEADLLRAAIRRRFWIPGSGDAPGYFAVALDGKGAQVDSVTSNMGHLLWCGVPSNDEAEQVATHLAGEDLSSGWGLRTLSRSMGGFNPISYHVGSVWPHDTAIACDGLRRYGFDEQAMRLADGLLDALNAFDDRLPELFGGHQRQTNDAPVPYPSACRPQAWAAGVPLALVAIALGIEPSMADGAISLQPALPRGVESLRVEGIDFPRGRLSIEVGGGGTRLLEAPEGVTIELRPSS
jgi:glycogen debranching enzyme